jgi:hypothetical protein
MKSDIVRANLHVLHFKNGTEILVVPIRQEAGRSSSLDTVEKRKEPSCPFWEFNLHFLGHHTALHKYLQL